MYPTPLRRASVIAVAVCAGGGIAGAVVVATPAAEATAGSRGRPTHYAMTAAADVGHVRQFRTPPPPTSGAVGARVVCTNRTRQRDTGAAADVDLRGVAVHDVRSTAWTSRVGRKTVSSSQSTIGRVEVADPSIGTVTITGIGSLSQAWHGRHGFHHASRATLSSIVLHPLSGDDVSYPLPQPGQPVTIEDTIRVGIGRGEGYETAHGAFARLDAVSVRLLDETFTKFQLGHTQSRIQGGVGHQLYGGISLPALGHDADGELGSARDSVETVPCVGSGGKLSGGTVYGRMLSDSVSARKVESYQRSGPDAGGQPQVFVRSDIRRVDIDGGIEVFGIHGRARSAHTRHGYHLSAYGSVVRRVEFNGVRVQMRRGTPVNVGGVAVLTPLIVTRDRGSIEVTALRVRMLDGSGQVFDLGFARAALRPSGV
jgi:hypothetical protein